MPDPVVPTTEGTQEILNFLASMPRYGHAAATKEQVRQIMLDTTGTLLAQGRLYDIKAKPLGGGIYRLTLGEHDV